MRRYTLVLAGLLLAAVSLMTPLSAHAIESAGIGAVPANPRPENPRTKSIFVYEAAGGKALKDAVRIINNTDKTKNIRVYPVDSQHSSDGAFACAQEADKKTGVGNWISLEKQEVTLQAGGNEVIPFTIDIPQNADAGEHNGCIAIQENVAPKQSSNNGIVLSFRSALRVAITVPGDIFADVRFKNVQTTILDGKLRFASVLANKGNISADADIKLGLTDIFGGRIAESGGKFALLKNEESTFNFETPRPFWGGWYQRTASANYSSLRENAVADKDKKNTTLPNEWFFVGPHPTALVIEIITLLFIVAVPAYIWWQRRQRAFLKLSAKPYIVQPEDNIQLLAQQAHVNWRRLAHMNNLKPPYILKPGQQIKLPKARNARPKRSFKR